VSDENHWTTLGGDNALGERYIVVKAFRRILYNGNFEPVVF
jgi:hypothetical protein